MKKLILTLLFSFFAIPAHSAIISGLQFLDDGRAVDLQGLEWLTLDETMGLIKFYPSSDGIPDYNILDDFPGWRYAASWEVQSLFASLRGGATSSTDQRWLMGALWFQQVFGVTDSGAGCLASLFYFGADEEIAAALGDRAPSIFGDAFGGFVDIQYDFSSFSPDHAVSASLYLSSLSTSYLQEAFYPYTSHMLVRGLSTPSTVPVPEPTTMILFSIGALSLFAKKRVMSLVRRSENLPAAASKTI